MDEIDAIVGRRRRSLIRLLKGSLERRPRQQQQKRIYQADFDRALGIVYESYGRTCAERLHPNLVELAEQLAAGGELALTEPLAARLATVGLTTVRKR